MRKIVAAVLATLLLLSVFSGCDVSPKTGRTFTDLLGREVTVPEQVYRVACIGSGALRLYSYIGDMSLLCGAESCEHGFLISVRPYQMVNESLFTSLASIGSGGPQGSPNAEALLSASPDVIFSLYTADASAMDELQAKTGIPVVVLSYGDSEVFDDDLTASLSLMGEILGRQTRAKQVCDFISAMKTDLQNRTKDIPDTEKRTVYLGCQSHYGTHGIGSSSANYSLFDAVDARNVLDEHGYVGYQRALDLETILTLNPEVIVIDAGGLSLLAEEYRENRAVFDSLSAFRNGEVYVQMPYNAYFTNLEIAFADAYFIGTVLYPEAFSDIDIEVKFDEICTTLLGQACYKAVAQTVGCDYGRLSVHSLLEE